jgi:vacuolar-type H+-ATPase subunit I/STV1
MKKHPFYVELNDPILSTSELQELIKKLEPDAQRWKDLDLWERFTEYLSLIMLIVGILSLLAYLPISMFYENIAVFLIRGSFGLMVLFWVASWVLQRKKDDYATDIDKLESIKGNDTLCESFLELVNQNNDEVIATFVNRIKSAGRYPTKAEYNCLVRYSENKNVHELGKVLNLSQVKS